MIYDFFKRFIGSCYLCVQIFSFTYGESEEDLLQEIILLARQNIGSEKSLNSITSLRYRGTIHANEFHEEKQMLLLLKKPFKQRLETQSNRYQEILATDGYEGYFKRIDIQGQGKEDPVVHYLSVDRIKRMRITTLENLNFFRSRGELGAVQEYGGLGVKRGSRCYKLVTRYDGLSEFVRFIDVNSGRLVSTKYDNNTEMIELGEILIDGIRFPQSLEAYKEGKLVSSITFSEIELNPELDDNLFIIEK